MGMLAIAAILAVGAAPELRVSAGLDAASGTYGHDEATTAVSRSLALDLGLGAWDLRVSGAHARIDGPASIVLLDDAAPPRRGGRLQPADDRREGFTDLSPAARWSPAPVERPWWYSLGVSATLPTGSPGLGRDEGDLFAFGL